MLHQTHLICDASSNVTFYKLHNILNQDKLLKKSQFMDQYFTIKLKYVLPTKNLISNIQTQQTISNVTTPTTRIENVVLKTSVFSFLHFDCHFLKKEKLYTKLKYSRSPQYDIVSGGVAALMSAFIGFLVSEKFGIELVDSGDFYVLFMYGVFIAFSLRPLIKIITKYDKLTPVFSLMPLITLSNQLLIFTLANIYARLIKLITRVKVFFTNN